MTRTTAQPRLTSRQVAESLGLTVDQWYWLGRTDARERPEPDGFFEGGRGDQPYWYPSTIERARDAILARIGVNSRGATQHRAIVTGMATPGLPDDAAGRAAVAADLGVHPRTVARHWGTHTARKCACFRKVLDNSPDPA